MKKSIKEFHARRISEGVVLVNNFKNVYKVSTNSTLYAITALRKKLAGKESDVDICKIL